MSLPINTIIHIFSYLEYDTINLVNKKLSLQSRYKLKINNFNFIFINYKNLININELKLFHIKLTYYEINHLLRLPNLNIIHLTNCIIPNSFIQLQNLDSLTIDNCLNLTFLHKLINLRRLVLRYPNRMYGLNDLNLEKLTKLKTLLLLFYINDTQIEYISKLSNIKILILGSIQNVTKMNYISKLTNLKILKIIHYCNNDLSFLSKMPNLNELYLSSRIDISEDNLKYISNLKNIKQFKFEKY